MDSPRGLKKYTLGHSYYGIEIIQNGCAYDKRYTTNNIWCIRPTIIIFTNMSPCFDLMNLDRWKVWEVATQSDLIPFESHDSQKTRLKYK